MLHRYQDDIHICAGGTDLIPSMKQRLFTPKFLMDIRGIEGRIGWLDRIGGLPAETTPDSMSAERAGKFVNHQHPDHDTPPDWARRR